MPPSSLEAAAGHTHRDRVVRDEFGGEMSEGGSSVDGSALDKSLSSSSSTTTSTDEVFGDVDPRNFRVVNTPTPESMSEVEEGEAFTPPITPPLRPIEPYAGPGIAGRSQGRVTPDKMKREKAAPWWSAFVGKIWP